MHPCRRFHEAQRFSSGRVITWRTCGNRAKVDKRSDAISSLGATEVSGAMYQNDSGFIDHCMLCNYGSMENFKDLKAFMALLV